MWAGSKPRPRTLPLTNALPTSCPVPLPRAAPSHLLLFNTHSLESFLLFPFTVKNRMKGLFQTWGYRGNLLFSFCQMCLYCGTHAHTHHYRKWQKTRHLKFKWTKTTAGRLSGLCAHFRQKALCFSKLYQHFFTSVQLFPPIKMWKLLCLIGKCQEFV